MAINFDNIPSEKPNTMIEVKGLQVLTIDDMSVGLTKTSQKEALNIKFKTEEDVVVFETFVDDEKPFLMFKLGRFLRAANVKLPGATLTMTDLMKVLRKGLKVHAVISKRKNGYPAVSFEGSNQGFYLPGEYTENDTPALQSGQPTNAPAQQPETPTLSPDINLSVSDTDDSY